jgi:glycosyltransferase involved in cell wall biosynthesis
MRKTLDTFSTSASSVGTGWTNYTAINLLQGRYFTSPDNTAQVAAALAREDPRVTVIRHTTNKGHINTYNEGIEWASADYMLLPHGTDNYLLPGALVRATNLMDAHPEVGFNFGNVIELSDNGNETLTKSVIKPTNDLDKRILEGRELIELTGAGGNQVTTCSAVVRTELQKHLGGRPS